MPNRERTAPGTVQACFRGQVSIHAILSLPLMRELTAVELLLANQLATVLVPPPQQPPPKLAAEPATEMEMQPLQETEIKPEPPTTDANEEDPGPNYTCPICLVCSPPFSTTRLPSWSTDH